MEGVAVFNRDGMFSKRDDAPRKDVKQAVNVTPGLSSPSPSRPQPEAVHADSIAAAAKPAPLARDGKGSKLIVGPDIKLKGAEITDCDTLVVEGRVEAAMDSRVIQIAEHGVFSGKVGIDIAEIHGRFEGELTARQQLVVHATGSVSGIIRYGKISIEEGGEVSGDVGSLTSAPPATKSAAANEASTSADIMTAYDPFAHKAKPQAGKH
jgi:cytoskeletal protein CcmA (bactofilin family)